MDIYDAQFDLEDFLAEDASGVNLRRMQDELREGLHELKRQIDKGLPPEDFKTAEGMKKAYETALEVITKAWENFHRA